jgi:hypothetical protein
MLAFHVEHIIPQQHGGITSEENLALSCPHCNMHKGPNLTGSIRTAGKSAAFLTQGATFGQNTSNTPVLVYPLAPRSDA